ncbi:MAG TPA: HAD family phosphatase [Puia sp.]|nr:HAD family phosphatase [Puia sp.]
MKQITTLVFDLGGVLIDWNPDYLYRTIFGDEKERLRFLSEVCTPDWNEEQDAGRSLLDGTNDLVQKFPEQEAPIRAFYDRWEEMLGGSITGTLEILRHLRFTAGIKTYALTNWSAETFPIALRRYDFLHWFDGRLVSGEEGIRKPDPGFYQLLIDRYGIRPEETVFVDDNARNLPPAASLGLHTIHFRSPGQFREELKALGGLGL